MAVKISQLSASTNVTSDDFFPVVDSGSMTTKRASAQQIIEYITGSTFNSLTVSNLTSSNITGSTALFTTITASFISASEYQGINFPSPVSPGGNDMSVQFNSGSTFSGSTNLVYNYTTNTLSGTTAQFTTITASQQLIQGDLRVLGTASVTQLNTIGQTSLLIGDKYITILSGGIDHTGINGSGFLWGTSSGPGETTGALGEHAHVLYDASRDALEVFPGLYVTGSTTLFEISGTTARFTTVTSSNVTGTLARFTTVSSSNLVVSGGNAIFYEQAVIGDNAYILYNSSIDKLAAFPGLYVTGAITASTSLSASNIGATTAIFSQVTASFSGSGANVTNLTASNILNFTNDVRAQFSQGTNITIVGGVISSTGGGGGTPGGTNTTIQFNSGSTFSGSSNFVWDYTNNTLNIGTSSNSVSRINLLANSTENNSAGDLKFVKQDGWLLSLNEIYSTGSSAAYHSPIFILQKSRGTPSSPTAVQNGDQVGGFFYRAYDGTTHKQRAGISAWVDGTVVNNSDVPMRLRFFAGTTEGENTDERFAVARNEVVVNNYAQSTDFRVEGTSDQNLLFVSGGVNRVGIGTSTPNAKLDVNGNTILSGNLTVTGSIFVSGSSIYGQVAELTSSTTNYTLVRQDSGKFLHMSSSTSMNLTVPSGLPVGFTVSFCQNGTGSINIVTGSGVVIRNRQSHTKTAGLYAVASLICTGSNGYIFTGDTSA